MNLTFRDIYEGKDLQAWVSALAGKSGVYVIREKGIFLTPILYVGESHTNNLKKTLLRHFQHWKGATAGNTYARSKVEVAVLKTRSANAVELQNALIHDLDPRDNINEKPRWFS